MVKHATCITLIEEQHFREVILKQLDAMTKFRKETYKLIESQVGLFDDTRHSLRDVEHDPWLSEKALARNVESMAQAENEARRALNLIILDMRKYDMSLVKALVNMLSNYAQTHRIYSEEIGSCVGIIQQFTSQFDNGGSFDDYSTRVHLTGALCFQANVSNEDFPIPRDKLYHASKIIKVGTLDRPGTILKSKFRPSIFVLTENGFLHCFKVTNSKETLDEVRDDPSRLLYSAYLRLPKVTVEESQVNVNCMEIVVPRTNRGFFGEPEHKYLVRAESKDEVSKWLEAIAPFLLKNRERPEIEE